MKQLCTALQTLAGLTWTGAVRGKAVILPAVLLPAMIALSPLAASGNARLAGESAAWLGYALRGAWIILNLATLWLACSAIAHEIDRRRYTLTAVKPVRPLTVWFGKWLGILLVQGTLLLLTGLAVFAGGRENLREGRAVLHPDLPAPADAVRERLAGNPPPEGTTEADLIRKETNRYELLAPGVATRLRFTFPQAPRHALTLRLATAAILGSRHEIAVDYELIPDSPSAPTLRGAFPDLRAAGIAFDISLAAWQNLTVESATLVLTRRVTPGVEAASLLFRPRQDLTLLCGGISFRQNLLRALVVQFALTAALAAFGLTLGILFSFPVALYMASLGLLIILVSGGNVSETTAQEREASRLIRIGVGISQAAQYVIPSANETDTLRQLLHGEAVDSRDMLARTARYLLFLPLLCALPGAWALGRKEL